MGYSIWAGGYPQQTPSTLEESFMEAEGAFRVGDEHLMAGWLELGCRTQKEVTTQGPEEKVVVAPNPVP